MIDALIESYEMRIGSNQRLTTVLSLLLWLSCGVEPEEPLFLNYHGYEYPVITEPSEIQVSDSIAALYREDAARLAVRIMLDVGGEAADEVEVPRDLWDALYNTILHFHDATELAARDTVVEMFPTSPYRLKTATGGWNTHWAGGIARRGA